jgi:hypothetical protein
MRKLGIILGVSALMMFAGAFAWQAEAATLQGAGSISSAAKNFTPIQRAACDGRWGPFCPPGRVRVCGPYRCWCRPCW